MTSKATTVDQYLKELPADRYAALVEIRGLIHKIAPDAGERMDYGMPTFGNICSFASQKQYMALYCDPDVVDSYRSKLGKLDCGKSCIRFKCIEDLPITVIESILKDTLKLRQEGASQQCC